MSATQTRRARAAALVGLVAATALGAASACVKIGTEPGGVASARLEPLPGAVVIGDTLRDTLGVPVRLAATAFDASGKPVSGAAFTFGYLPLRSDTTRPIVDSTLVITGTGLVRATTPWTASRARLVARLGGLQLLDTLLIVARPTHLARAANTDSVVAFRFLCTDTGRTRIEAAPDTVGRPDNLGNVSTALAVLLRGDSVTGKTVPVPGYYVRYDLLSPVAIPTGTSPFGDVRPGLYLTSTSDRPLRFDTTNSTGTTQTRLRVLPLLLTRSRFPDTTVTLRVRATATVGRGVPLPDTVYFTVRLTRRAPTGRTLQDCP